ncbi:MAG: magnesium transporter CorA family protein [Solirubrobacterales bacterium]
MPGRIRRRSGSASVEDLVPEINAEPRVEQIEHDGIRWINIERPGPAEELWLRENFDFHDLDYEDVRSRNQRPKIDEYDDYLFIILHLAVFDKRVGRLNAAELDMFVGPDFVITLPNEELKPVEYLYERCKSHEETREQRMSQGPGYLLYTIVDDAFSSFFPMLRKMGLKLDNIEEQIFLEENSREVVRDISNVKQEIINFRKIIRPQRAVLRDLERVKMRFIAEDLEIYFDDIVDASERMWDMLENYKEVVEALEATNESVISHDVTDVLRVLTIFSVFFLPLTLISGIFGMNNLIPGEGTSEGFWIVIGIMVATVSGMIVFFRRRGWL